MAYNGELHDKILLWTMPWEVVSVLENGGEDCAVTARDQCVLENHALVAAEMPRTSRGKRVSDIPLYFPPFSSALIDPVETQAITLGASLGEANTPTPF